MRRSVVRVAEGTDVVTGFTHYMRGRCLMDAGSGNDEVDDGGTLSHSLRLNKLPMDSKS